MPIRVTCSNCSKVLNAPDSAAGKKGKCPACGEFFDIPAVTPPAEGAASTAPAEEAADQPPPSPAFISSLPAEMKANKAIAGRTCPVCQAEIAIGEDVRNCEHCNLSYHLKCWNDNGGCKTLGCPLAPLGESEAPAAPGPAEESGDRKPCPVCGEMIKEAARKCRFCGEILDATLGAEPVDPELIKRFRREIHGLGGIWIFFGICGLALAAGALSGAARARGIEPAAGVIFGLVGLCWLAAGVLACLKKMWAVYAGLVLSYIGVLGNLIKFNPCGLIIIIIVLIQAHRTISWAKKMQAQQIPLDSKPE